MDSSTKVPHPQPRRILIDALNVAYWCGNPPSLRLPMTLMTALLAAGHQTQLYFDASAPHRFKHECDLYAQLRRHTAYCIEVESGRTADQLILKQARANGACIVSRDKYGDHRRRYRKLIDDPSRLMWGWVSEGRLLVPPLALTTPLPVSAQEAWETLQSFLSGPQSQPLGKSSEDIAFSTASRPEPSDCK